MLNHKGCYSHNASQHVRSVSKIKIDETQNQQHRGVRDETQMIIESSSKEAECTLEANHTQEMQPSRMHVGNQPHSSKAHNQTTGINNHHRNQTHFRNPSTDTESRNSQNRLSNTLKTSDLQSTNARLRRKNNQ